MRAIIVRICKQMKNDKRSLILMFVSPLVFITILYFLLGDIDMNMRVIINNGTGRIEELFEEGFEIVNSSGYSDSPEELLKNGDIDAYIDINTQPNSGALINVLMLEENAAFIKKINDVMKDIQVDVIKQKGIEINYVYGSNLNTNFEKLVYVLLGVISFFLVFIIAGISFVRERTMGTLERFMLTPIGRNKVVSGYIIGFEIFGALQSIIILLYVHFVLGIDFNGSIIEASFIMVLLSLAAVSIGAFVSIFANSEFQVVQFIPIIIIPQVFYSGLIHLEGLPLNLEYLKYVMPIHYGCNSLKKILIEGQGLADIKTNIIVLILIIIGFYILNVISLKKYRVGK